MVGSFCRFPCVSSLFHLCLLAGSLQTTTHVQIGSIPFPITTLLLYHIRTNNTNNHAILPQQQQQPLLLLLLQPHNIPTTTRLMRVGYSLERIRVTTIKMEQIKLERAESVKNQSWTEKFNVVDFISGVAGTPGRMLKTVTLRRAVLDRQHTV